MVRRTSTAQKVQNIRTAKRKAVKQAVARSMKRKEAIRDIRKKAIARINRI